MRQDQRYGIALPQRWSLRMKLWPRRELWRARRTSACLALWLCACTTDSSRPSADASVDTLANAPPLWGAIEILLQEELVGARGARSVVVAKVYDGPPLVQVPLVVAKQMGSCHLLTPVIAFCDPACAGG